MNQETTALRLSAYATAFFGILGTGFGLWIRSDAILLDGVFNWISFAMALLSLKVAAMVARPADESYPFGYAGFEPLVNTVKSLLIIGVSAFALFGALETLLAGGRRLEAAMAVVYAAVAVTGCFSVSFYQTRVARQTASPLVAVDAKNWFVNGVISSSVGVAFLAAMLLKGTALDGLVPYVDSGLVVLLVLLTVPIPVKMARESLGELLGYAPPAEVCKELHDRFEEIVRDTAVESFLLRSTAVGRTIFLLAETRVPVDQTVASLDTLRHKIRTLLLQTHPHLVMDIVFRPA